jgi:hypothetical protein
MKIIADTHIFYYLGLDPELFEKVSAEPISPNIYNILELSSTPNLIKIEDEVREAHRKLIHYNDHLILEPPFIYIAKMFCDVDFFAEKQFGDFFKFSSAIANGAKVDPHKIELYHAWAKDIRSNGDVAAEFANKKLEEIRPNIIDKKAHRKKDTIQVTLSLIRSLVIDASKGGCDVTEKDLSGIELLVRTMDFFFKELEVSQQKMKPNDLADLFMLAYVQPGDKFWTTEKQWIRMIADAGCEEYLFKI